MKTLDEVIKANECCDHGEPDSRCEDCPYNGIGACCAERETDALHYLKEYQKDKQIYAYDIARRNIELSEKNNPLTWSELKQMEGKPVWVEMVGFSLGGYPMSWKYWAIVSLCDEEILRIVHDQFENLDLADEELGVWNANAIWDMPKEDYGKTWQAYRKELKNV